MVDGEPLGTGGNHPDVSCAVEAPRLIPGSGVNGDTVGGSASDSPTLDPGIALRSSHRDWLDVELGQEALHVSARNGAVVDMEEATDATVGAARRHPCPR
jgi:hypothetical protein